MVILAFFDIEKKEFKSISKNLTGEKIELQIVILRLTI